MSRGETVLEVPFFRPSVGDEEVAAVERVLRSGWLTTGSEVREFEREFASWLGSPHAVALNSCTAALHLALDALGVGAGDSVLVPTFTFAATAEVVRYRDATPVFVDVDPVDLDMDPGAVEATLAELSAGRPAGGLAKWPGPPRALIPVHYAGQICQMDRLARLAARYGLRVVEDAAHTLPAYQSEADRPLKAAGTFGDVGCFSFYANKPLTTGEGGMAITADERLAERMRMMSLHGMAATAWDRFSRTGSIHNDVVDVGYKYNLTDIAAAMGRVQLRRAGSLWEERKRLARLYAESLADVEEIALPAERAGSQHSWHLFVLRLRLERLLIDRDAFVMELRERGIGAMVHWRPLHLHPYYRDRYGLRPDQFPVVADAWPRIVSLPFFPGMSEEELQAVAAAVKDVVARHRRRG